MSDSAARPLDAQTPQAGVDVRLENFEGPLDLLLYLIKKNDLNISDIPIAQITQEYLAYLDLMKDLDLETAGDFLVMASMLMQIKAQMLLPVPDAGEEEGPDPRTELMNRLIEYQQYKEASGILLGFHDRAKEVQYRAAPPQFGDDDFTLKASVFDLLNAFKRLLEEAPKEAEQILRDEVPLEARIREVLELLTEKTSVSFDELFSGGRRRIELIVTFMAVLELMRLKQIVARQADVFGTIRIYKAEAAPLEEVVAEAMLAPAAVSTPEPEQPAVPTTVVIEASEPLESPEDVAAMSLEDLIRPMDEPEAEPKNTERPAEEHN
jgi:segregation and condensation protein A